MSNGNKRGILNNMAFMLKNIVRNDKYIILFASLYIPVNVVNQFINVYLTATIVGLVTGKEELPLISTILAFAGCKFITSVLLQYSDKQLTVRNYKSRMQFFFDYAQKYMKADFSVIESIDGKNTAQRAKNTMFRFDYRTKSAVESIPMLLASLFSNLLGLFVYGGIISILNPFILLALACTAALSCLFQRFLVKYDQKDKKRYVPIERKIYYVLKESQNLGAAKDIKLYKISNWFNNIFDEQIKRRIVLYKKRGKYQYSFNAAIAIVNVIFNGFIYFYLINRYIAHAIDIIQFILYFGLITGFNSWLLSIVGNIEELNSSSFDIGDLRSFYDIAEPKESQEQRASNGGCAIDFNNVSFMYTSTRKNVIRNMTFHIRHGEKIAIVGVNGAGKTTLVKLVCGLYYPTEGSIFIGGTDTRNINVSALYDMFSVVFQDVYLLPTTIERNITMSDQTDKERFEQVLLLSGLKEKIERLPDKEKTTILKSVLDNAVDLSGGEIQKLALARALYKNGSIIVLDEPTAALDPIAENEMYQKYNMLTQGKTAIFISHRLSSTRFCDRIFFIDNGQIAESGTHDELMRLGGKYAVMYELQSHYYRQDMEV